VARVRAELLFTPDCPHARRAEELLRAVLTEEEDRPPRVDRVMIDDLDHAAGLGFVGSPTIRLDGEDVVPSDGAGITLGCRLYRQPDGSLDGVPPVASVRDALHRRRERTEAAAARPGPLATLREVPARVLRAGFVWASQRDSLERLATRLPVTRGLVARFVAGDDLSDALHALERLRASGLRTTVDVLGESVGSRDDATAAADRYLEALDALAEHGLDGNVSLKLTQMGLDIDPVFCRRNVARIVRRAADLDAFVRVDMEDSTRADATLAVARDLFSEFGNVGVVIQSYLRRSAADIEQLNAARIRVRLCKGAYSEPPSVAFETKADVDESYRDLMERLLLEGTYPGLATHDETLIEQARRFVAERAIGPERYEFQMLFGVRRDLQSALAAQGHTVRIYVPYGAEWYPYFMRRLAERPANLLFVLRSIVRESRGPRR
jgi:proline dehydrogenase